MRISFLSGVITATIFVGSAVAVAVLHPDTPLPPSWNPVIPLDVSEPVTALTDWKLRRAVGDPEACLRALPVTGVERMPALVEGGACGIDPRVSVRKSGAAQLTPVETTCAIALRLAMWERHTLQPAAQDTFGTGVDEIRHLSSYNCRPIRTPGGTGSRMSTHATGEAIDITGFVLGDGRRISLLEDWDGEGDAAAFLRKARDGSCRWFRTTLGPDYNSLHADHFHLQSRGWGLCR